MCCSADQRKDVQLRRGGDLPKGAQGHIEVASLVPPDILQGQVGQAQGQGGEEDDQQQQIHGSRLSARRQAQTISCFSLCVSVVRRIPPHIWFLDTGCFGHNRPPFYPTAWGWAKGVRGKGVRHILGNSIFWDQNFLDLANLGIRGPTPPDRGHHPLPAHWQC